MRLHNCGMTPINPKERLHLQAEPMSRLTDQGLAVLTSPDLGPCRVKHLVLEGQRNVTGTGVRALTAGRFPGAHKRPTFALLDIVYNSGP